MKYIDEKFFELNENNSIKTIDNLLVENEKILWKGKPKKFSYVMNKSIALMPIALIWVLIDFSIIFSIFKSGAFGFSSSFLTIFIIGFFALHLMPFWTWIGSIIKASKEMKGVEYIITNQRIFGVQGKNQLYITAEVNLDKLGSVCLKRSFIDKLLKVGDIYIYAKDKKSIVLFDIPNCEFITQRIKDIMEMQKVTNKTKFYENNHECSHCGTYFDASKNRCPSCGASVDKK